MVEARRSDVIILGAGLVGMALALALATGGLAVTLVDPADPHAQLGAGFDGRASALSSSSWRERSAGKATRSSASASRRARGRARSASCPISTAMVRSG